MSLKRILVIEDEPLLCDAYKLVFEQISKENKANTYSVDTARTVSKAKEFIKLSLKRRKPYSLVVLDMRIASGLGTVATYGVELGMEIRKLLSPTKVVIVTSIADNYLFHSIIKKINPEGFMIKSEIDFQKFRNDIILIMQNHNCYSQTILNYLKNVVHKDSILDDIDREILYHLSKGIQLSKLPNYVPLSLSGIERRKRILAQYFNLKTSKVNPILQKARELGFL